MKNILSITAGVLIIGAIIFMVYTNLTRKKTQFPRQVPVECSPENPYAYSIDSLAEVDSQEIGYTLVKTLSLSSFETPSAVALSRDDTILVADGKTIVALDSAGNETGRIKNADPVTCIAVSENITIFAGSRKAIFIYKKGNYVSPDVWWVGAEKSYFTSLAVSENAVFAADAGLRLVWKLDHSGKVTGKIGLKDTTRGIPGFVVPSPYMDVALGRGGTIWVVNPGRHQLENYRPNGDLVSSWGSSGTALNSFCGCCNPVQMTLLSNGSFITAEKGIVRVKEYDPTGTFKTVVAVPPDLNPKETNLDLAVDSRGRILVLERYEKRIRFFKKK